MLSTCNTPRKVVNYPIVAIIHYYYPNWVKQARCVVITAFRLLRIRRALLYYVLDVVQSSIFCPFESNNQMLQLSQSLTFLFHPCRHTVKSVYRRGFSILVSGFYSIDDRLAALTYSPLRTQWHAIVQSCGQSALHTYL